MQGQLAVGTPEQYLDSLQEPRKSEIARIDAFIRSIAPELEPHICAGILAYGRYHYRYSSGREGDWFRVGLASNKQYISIYVCASDGNGYIAEQNKHRLPKAKIGRSCIRFKRFDDLDVEVMRELVRQAATLGFSM
jgi:hypothetical protein